MLRPSAGSTLLRTSSWCRFDLPPSTPAIGGREHGNISEADGGINGGGPNRHARGGQARAHRGSCSPDSQHDAQVNRRHSLCCRCQRRLQSFDIRTQIRLPAAGTTAFGAMLIGDFLVDSSEGRRGETHHRHGRELGDTKDIAERHHDGTMHLCAGRFAVRIWLHKSLRPLPCSRMADGRAATTRSEVNSAWSAYARDRYALMQPPSSCCACLVP